MTSLYSIVLTNIYSLQMIYIPAHGSHGHLQTLNKWYYVYNNGFTWTKQNNNKNKNKLNIVILSKKITKHKHKRSKNKHKLNIIIK